MVKTTEAAVGEMVVAAGTVPYSFLLLFSCNTDPVMGICNKMRILNPQVFNQRSRKETTENSGVWRRLQTSGQKKIADRWTKEKSWALP